MRKNTPTLLLTSLALVALVACRTGTDARVQNAVAQTTMASAGAGTNNITDADAGAVARAINDGEIQMAQVALAQAVSPRVREYAQRMIDDHTSANSMLQTHGYGMMRNAITDVLNADVNRRMTMLRGKSGDDFDRAYMGSQIDMHQTALETMRTTLLPSAREQNLRQTLSTMQESVQMHLRHAQEIESALTNR
jgi:putative membrane protein